MPRVAWFQGKNKWKDIPCEGTFTQLLIPDYFVVQCDWNIYEVPFDIGEIAKLGKKYGIPVHVDACLGIIYLLIQNHGLFPLENILNSIPITFILIS